MAAGAEVGQGVRNRCGSSLLKKISTRLGQLRKSTGEFGRSAQGTPKLTIKKLRPAGFRSTRSVYHNRIVFTHGFINTTLSTAIFITAGVYNVHQPSQALLQVTGVNANSILSQRERVTHPVGQS